MSETDDDDIYECEICGAKIDHTADDEYITCECLYYDDVCGKCADTLCTGCEWIEAQERNAESTCRGLSGRTPADYIQMIMDRKDEGYLHVWDERPEPDVIEVTDGGAQ